MARLPKSCVIGFFNDPDQLVHAAGEATNEGFRNCDAYSPYPIHGIEEVLRIRRSWIPSAALTGLLIGACLGFALQYWTHVIDWPINVGGKPLNAWPAYVVIVFECGVLCSALTNFLSMFVACRLVPHPFPDVIDEDLTNDRFALVIPARSDEDESAATQLLKRLKADEIRKVEQ
ncbi:MAG: hypothetical protein PWP23_2454 [Candidatus Sumerlaeota bacterium]|nr:hypothetical protein [Candidatus Sumerlaeota bacterium]